MPKVCQNHSQVCEITSLQEKLQQPIQLYYTFEVVKTEQNEFVLHVRSKLTDYISIHLFKGNKEYVYLRTFRLFINLLLQLNYMKYQHL